MGLGAVAKILVVDDHEQVRNFFRDLLEQEGYQVHSAGDGVKALEMVNSRKPDLVLLDLYLPSMDGLEVLRILKAPNDDLRFLPVILLTGKGDEETRLQGLRLGADDYLVKPANVDEILARIEVLLRIKRLHDEVRSSRENLKDQSMSDSVTGFFNARYLDHRLRDEFSRAERYNEPLACLSLYVDGLGMLLDSNKEVECKPLVKQLADIVRACVREFDIIVRIDSDRFLCILPRTHFLGLLQVTSQIWRRVHTRPFRLKDKSVWLGAWMGGALYPTQDVADSNKLFEKAEQALEHAVLDGRHPICIMHYTPYFYRPDQAEVSNLL